MSLRHRQPGAPLYRVLWWYVYHVLCFVLFVPLYRYRTYGVHNIPDTGPVLLLSNHQSFFDPIVIGLAAHKRHFYAMARATLWDSAIYRRITVPLNAVPVDQGTGDVKAIKRCIEVLNEGHALLIFPEGARCEDGEVHDFQSGLMLILKRAKPAVVPLAVEGAFDIWPIGAKRPKLRGRVACSFGPPIPAQDLLDLSTPDALNHLQHQVIGLQDQLRQTMR